jgi:hypothetical protein
MDFIATALTVEVGRADGPDETDEWHAVVVTDKPAVGDESATNQALLPCSRSCAAQTVAQPKSKSAKVTMKGSLL